jgi:hypothetical protein
VAATQAGGWIGAKVKTWVLSLLHCLAQGGCPVLSKAPPPPPPPPPPRPKPPHMHAPYPSVLNCLPLQACPSKHTHIPPPLALTDEVCVEHAAQQLLPLGEGPEDLTAGEGAVQEQPTPGGGEGGVGGGERTCNREGTQRHGRKQGTVVTQHFV